PSLRLGNDERLEEAKRKQLFERNAARNRRLKWSGAIEKASRPIKFHDLQYILAIGWEKGSGSQYRWIKKQRYAITSEHVTHPLMVLKSSLTVFPRGTFLHRFIQLNFVHWLGID
ncbi:hypothetical protein Tcan_00499, partial [Toxocara canis]